MCHVLGRLADTGVLAGELQLGELSKVVSQHLPLLSIGVHWVVHSPVCVCVEEEVVGVGMEGGGHCCYDFPCTIRAT